MPLAAIGHEGALTRTEGVTRYTSDGDLTPARTVRAAVTAALAKVAAVTWDTPPAAPT